MYCQVYFSVVCAVIDSSIHIQRTFWILGILLEPRIEISVYIRLTTGLQFSGHQLFSDSVNSFNIITFLLGIGGAFQQNTPPRMSVCHCE